MFLALLLCASLSFFSLSSLCGRYHLYMISSKCALRCVGILTPFNQLKVPVGFRLENLRFKISILKTSALVQLNLHVKSSRRRNDQTTTSKQDRHVSRTDERQTKRGRGSKASNTIYACVHTSSKAVRMLSQSKIRKFSQR